MPRTARRAPGGYVYHVLNRGNGRAPVFEDDGDYAAFERVLAGTLARHPAVRLLAYCLMPNHWHLLLWPRRGGGPAGQLGAFMQRLTVTHVRRWHAHRHSDGGGHLYQGPYKSFPVQDDRHFLVVARYVERNALRAGLVKRAEDWRHGSLWQRHVDARHADADADGDGDAAAGGNAGAPPLSDWPVERPADWLAWVNEPETPAELEALRRSCRRGAPFGPEPWAREIARVMRIEPTLRPRGRPKKADALLTPVAAPAPPENTF